jgi:NAD(P)-dependent dehydrogenase (short-subunit alcohol dehydrogenase family)
MTGTMSPQRHALVTAAGQGVGRGVALALGAAGYVVAVNDWRAERAEAVAAEIVEAGGRALAVPFDVRAMAEVREAVERIAREAGPVDVLVNCAGSGIEVGANLGCKFSESDPESWRKSIELDLLGSLTVMRVVLPGMSARGWGRVVQISSGAGSRGHPKGLAIYGAAKAGIEGAVRHIAMEEAASGVTVNAIALGLISNAAVRQSIVDPTASGAGTLASVPIGRFVEPSEVGAFVLWLASEAAGAVTGQTMHINGGTFQGR